ncbi:MAG: lipoyl(octanoyl) transferase LipB [Bacteroidia bacterium]
MQAVLFHDLGLIDYQQCWDLQEKLFSGITQIKISNRERLPDNQILPEHHLIFCEHPHVYTLGKSGDEKNLLVSGDGLKAIEATYYKINRGGDITYHGPGQLVGYPILDLDQFFTDIHKYLRFLEEAVILTMQEYGLHGERYSGYTGVWLDADVPERARKICAIGVRASRWVTMHGWAFNVNTNLDYFKHIVPCGIDDKAVTSMQAELGYALDMDEVKAKLRHHFESLFACSLVENSISVL